MIRFDSPHNSDMAHTLFATLAELGIENHEIDLTLWVGQRGDLRADHNGWYVVIAEMQHGGTILGLCTSLDGMGGNRFSIHVFENEHFTLEHTLRHELYHIWEYLHCREVSEIDAERFALLEEVTEWQS